MAKKSVKKSVKKTEGKAARREGSGRPLGSGKFGSVETKVIRIPVHLEQEVKEFVLRKIKSSKSS